VHEYSIVQELLERVDHEAKVRSAARVHRVRVSIGELSGVEIDLLRTAFETIRHRTSCHDAVLDIRRVEARWECSTCAAPIERGGALRCRSCGRPARLASGDEIMLEQIEMEAA
jgi:hydrogenase nickel incorporation protein HypA/HybF